MKKLVLLILVISLTLFSAAAENMKNLYIPISSTGQVMRLDLDKLEPIGDPITVGTNPNSATVSPDCRYVLTLINILLKEKVILLNSMTMQIKLSLIPQIKLIS